MASWAFHLLQWSIFGVLAWFLIPTVGASKYWWRKCKGLSDGIASATATGFTRWISIPQGHRGSLFTAAELAQSLKRREECCSLEAGQVLFRGGLYRMCMPSEILFDTQNAHFVWVMALLVSFAQYSWAWEVVARKFYPLIFQLYWQFTAFARLKTSEATPMLLLGFHQTFPLGSGALEVSGVVKRRWDLQRWPYIHNFAFNESCVYLKTYFLFTNRWHILMYS